MSLYIKFGNYVHDVGTASVAINIRKRFDETGLRKIGSTVSWTINGTLIADGAAALQAKKTALETAYEEGNVDLKLLESPGGVVRASLSTSLCKGGTRVTDGPTYPDSRGGIWVTHIPYTVTVEGDVFDGEVEDSSIIELEENTQYTIGQDTHTTRTVSGRLRTADSVSAYSKAQDRDPDTPEGYQRMGYNIEHNDVNDEATYSYTDWEYWTALPAGTTVGGYTTQRSVTENQRNVVTVAGSFTGAGAQAAADAAKISDAAYDTLSEQQTVNNYDGSISFTYEYFDRGSSEDIIEWEESVSLQASGTRFVLRPILNPGENPVKQDLCTVPARATQSGRAVGIAGYPQFPDMLYSGDYYNVEQSSKTKRSPRKGPNATYTNYEISWTYTFDLPFAASLEDPNVI